MVPGKQRVTTVMDLQARSAPRYGVASATPAMALHGAGFALRRVSLEDTVASNDSSALVVGNYCLVTVPAWSAVVSLDVSDPAAPRKASRLALGPDDVPHWISVSNDRRRAVVTGYGAMADRVVIARFDPTTGHLSLDARFREAGATEPGFRMAGKTWPHGSTARGIPHGAVFGR